MSQAEIERFVAALRTAPELAESYGTAADLTELTARLRADGYEVSEVEVAGAAPRRTELSDEDLDGASGGAKQRPTPAHLLNMIRF